MNKTCRNVSYLWLRTILSSAHFNGVKLHIINSSLHLWVRHFRLSHQNLLILKQELSLVTLSCMFYSAECPPYLKSGLTCFDLWGKTAVSLWGKSPGVFSEDKQTMHQTAVTNNSLNLLLRGILVFLNPFDIWLKKSRIGVYRDGLPKSWFNI